MPSPFFESPPRVGGRRLLLVTYAFPPDASVGALRWERMLRLAARNDWAADVLLMDPADSIDLDHSRLATLPPGIRLFKVKLPDSLVTTLVRWRRRWPGAEERVRAAEVPRDRPAHAEPDSAARLVSGLFARLKREILARSYYARWRRWARRAAAAGVALSGEVRFECVISSGPPHMAHEAARRIARSIGRPFIADFRDPWTSDDVEPPDVSSSSWKSLSRRYERACIESAALVVANTPSAARLIASDYPHLASRIITVMNGADDDESPGPAERSSKFTIAYVGSVYGGRYPQTLFHGVHLALNRCAIAASEISLHFMGVEMSQGDMMRELAEAEGIAECLVCESRRPRADAVALLDRSDMLVVLPQIHLYSVPAKVFEYVQRRAWLLVLADRGTATFELLEGSAVDLVSPGNADEIAQAICDRFAQWKSGERPVPVNADGRFNRSTQAEHFFRNVERLLRATTPGAAEHAGLNS